MPSFAQRGQRQSCRICHCLSPAGRTGPKTPDPHQGIEAMPCVRVGRQLPEDNWTNNPVLLVKGQDPSRNKAMRTGAVGFFQLVEIEWLKKRAYWVEFGAESLWSALRVSPKEQLPMSQRSKGKVQQRYRRLSNLLLLFLLGSCSLPSKGKMVKLDRRFSPKRHN